MAQRPFAPNEKRHGSAGTVAAHSSSRKRTGEHYQRPTVLMLIRWEGLRRSSSSSSSEVMSGRSPHRSGRPSRTAVSAAVSALLLLLCLCADVGSASPGDQSAEYKSCLRRCRGANCTLERQEAFRANQPWYLALLRWDCADECRHDCMWQAVDRLQANGSPVPQFYGKVRPASMLVYGAHCGSAGCRDWIAPMCACRTNYSALYK